MLTCNQGAGLVTTVNCGDWRKKRKTCMFMHSHALLTWLWSAILASDMPWETLMYRRHKSSSRVTIWNKMNTMEVTSKSFSFMPNNGFNWIQEQRIIQKKFTEACVQAMFKMVASAFFPKTPTGHPGGQCSWKLRPPVQEREAARAERCLFPFAFHRGADSVAYECSTLGQSRKR